MTPRELRSLLAQLRQGSGSAVPTISRAELEALTPAEKVNAFRQIVRGQLRVAASLERPMAVKRADLASMTPAEMARRYRELVRS
jgi:hypothetical protein